MKMKRQKHWWLVPAAGALLLGGCASLPVVQAAAPAAAEETVYRVATGNTSFEKVWTTTNGVLAEYFARLLVDREGGYVRSEVKGNSITEWLRIDPETLKITCSLSRQPVRLSLKAEAEEKKGDKWTPRELTVKEKAFIFNLTQEIEVRIRGQQ